MQLDDLIDIETQALADRDANEADLRARDARIRDEAIDERGDRAERLLRWISAIREGRRDPLPGRTVVQTYRAIQFVIALIAALIGWGTAAAALHYDGDDPINVLGYLSVFVFLQAIVVAFSLAVTPLLRATGARYDRLPMLALLQSGIQRVVAAGWRRWAREKDAERRARAERIWNTLNERRGLYEPAQQWLLLETFQWGAVAFNIAAILRLVTLVTFSDLTFGWFTTLDISGATFHSVVHGFSLPWSWLAPSAVPTEELVSATRYSRFEGAFLSGGAFDAASGRLAGQWWRFLLAATVVWGLLPRIALLVYARVSLRRFLNGLRFHTPMYAAIDQRLARPSVSITNRSVDPGDDSALPQAEPAFVDRDGTFRCATVIWRDARVDEPDVRRWLSEGYGYESEQIHRAGSTDYSADQAFFALVREEKPESIAIVVEAWESPDKAVMGFVKELRAAAAQTGIVVLLVDGSNYENQLWMDYLGQLRDPYLEVTPVPASPS